MTTIAYKCGVLAGDGLSLQDGVAEDYSFPKVFQIRDGRLVGVSGTYARCLAVKRWLEERGDLDHPPNQPKMEDDDGSVIVVQADGTVRVYELDGWFDYSPQMAAWGSGAKAALGAMHAGATAVEAVEIAAKIDPFTGGEVISVRLDRTVYATQGVNDLGVTR